MQIGKTELPAWLAGGAAIAIVLTVYAPSLGTPPVAEDYQFILKAARIAADPAEIGRPFQLVWRPAAWVAFVPLAGLTPDAWVWARAAQLLLGIAAAVLACAVLRSLFGLPRPAAVTLAALWVVSPLASEPLLGETALIGHELLAIGMLGVLLARRSGRPGPAAACALLAAAASEQWVVLPVLLLLDDVLLRGRRVGQALVSATPWIVALAAWLAAYAAITGFAYRSVFRLDVAGLAAKLAGTAGAFFRLLPVSALAAGGLPRHHLAGAFAGLALGLALLAWALLARRREALFGLAAGAALLAPTAVALGQSPRWTALAYVFVVGGCGTLAVELWRHARLGRIMRWPLAALAAALGAADAVTVRGDIADWAAFAALGRRVAAEAGPLLAEARAGVTLVVLRGDDHEPLRRLLWSPRGQPKMFMPRPDDPYGAVSLQALLTCELRRGGLAVERIATPAAGAAAVAFVHEEGGFRRLPAPPGVPVRHPASRTEGAAGVILAQVPWSGFKAAAFP